MYDMLSVAITGFSDVASPLRPITMSLPAARPAPTEPSESTRASTATTMAWITEDLPFASSIVMKSRGSSGAAAERRIDRIAQRVAEEVRAQHGDEDRETGER